MPVVVVARIRKIRKQSNKIKGVIKFDEKFYVQHQRETNWENFEIQGALNERKYNKLTRERTHEHTNTCRYQHTWKIYILFYREQQQQRKLFRSEKEIIVPVHTYIQKILETWRRKYFDMLHLLIQRFISEHWLWTGDRKLEKASGECPHALCRCRRTYNIVGIIKSSSLLIPDPQFDENIDIEVEHLIAYHYFLR